ncbi:hypothetical protein REPUB_Repub14bG0151400 [Reevesia pubescens]
MWISLPYVSLDDNDLTGDYTTRKTKFINIVDKVLLHRRNYDLPNIKKLQLACPYAIGDSECARWFQSVLRDGFEEVDLKFGTSLFPEDPLRCLNIPCNSLVTLKLNFGPLSAHRFPSSFYFPNLKNMHLKGFMLANNFTDHLLKCRKLENLILSYFMFDCPFSKDKVANGYDRHQNFPNLSNAKFNCPSWPQGTRCLFLRNLFTLVSNAKALKLSFSVIEYLLVEPNFPDHFPKFNNLKHLKLCLQTSQVRVMNDLIQMSPSLESLHIDFDTSQTYSYGCHNDLRLEQLRSSCSHSCLKVLRISHLIPENPEITNSSLNPQNARMELSKLFFESAGFLKKITIELDHIGTTDPFLHCQKILEFPRLSKSLVLEVKWDNGSHTFNLCNY